MNTHLRPSIKSGKEGCLATLCLRVYSDLGTSGVKEAVVGEGPNRLTGGREGVAEDKIWGGDVRLVDVFDVVWACSHGLGKSSKAVVKSWVRKVLVC